MSETGPDRASEKETEKLWMSLIGTYDSDFPYQPHGDWVFIERIEPTEQKTASGLIIPETTRQVAWRGKVIATGEGGYLYKRMPGLYGKRVYKTDESGNLVRYPMDVSPGDEVLYVQEKASFDFIAHGRHFTIIDIRWIDAIVE